ncbi:hypothetical protein [Alkalibacillus aidingensis]|uniref:hypothetical protein n=1 Tax=Alkalibacillus aidingensis TaxID=2747607 RepID=UPI001660413F|nr:hypothetical protein [Alkalibacillus aidingensis]
MDQVIHLIAMNWLFISLFLIMMVCLYFLLKPVIKLWIRKNCLHAILYWLTTSTLFFVIVGYLHITGHELVHSKDGMKQLVISLSVAFSSFGLILVGYSLSRSLSQIIRNRNTTS